MKWVWRVLLVFSLFLALPGCEGDHAQEEQLLKVKPDVSHLAGAWNVAADSGKYGAGNEEGRALQGGLPMQLELKPDGTFCFRKYQWLPGVVSRGNDLSGTWSVSDEMLADGRKAYGVCLQHGGGRIYLRLQDGEPRSLVVPVGDPTAEHSVFLEQAGVEPNAAAEEDYGAMCLQEIGQCFKSLGMAIYYGVVWLWRLCFG